MQLLGLDTTSVFLDGDKSSRSRFGTTITNLGDLDQDGYVDIAVGAPGGDDGAVYIYQVTTWKLIQ